MVDAEELRRFQAASDKIIQLTERERVGIGMQKEKTVHAILKNTKDPDPAHQEVHLGNFIADIYDGEQVIEIQSGNFGTMWNKLRAFLPICPVTIVYPIPHIKYITWVDPETGELVKRNKSTHRGTFYHAFKEMGKIRELLPDPNLTINPMLLEIEEYRLLDGWSHDRKRGSHRYDRVPTGIYDEMLLYDPCDYAVFIPESLRDCDFTSKDLAQAVGIKEKSISYSNILLTLTTLGVVERIGKMGRSYLYRYICKTLE